MREVWHNHAARLPAVSARGPIWRQPGMASLVVMTCAGFSGYAVLLTVAPLSAVEGGATTAGSGLVNGVLVARWLGDATPVHAPAAS